jgi:hypothetical protein
MIRGKDRVKTRHCRFALKVFIVRNSSYFVLAGEKEVKGETGAAARVNEFETSVRGI